jgi:ABC-type phosphate/phosphonate transport system substrate-binding protein
MRAGWMVTLLMGGSVLMAGPAVAQGEPSEKSLRIGLVRSLFRNMPESIIEVVSRPLQALMERQTGLRGLVHGCGEAGTLGKMLQEGKIDLALFHGFELAWVKERYPDLLPLVLVSNARPLQACLIIRKSTQVKAVADLKGQYVAVPIGSRGHCYLFLERRCCLAGNKPEKFFKKVTAPADAPAALEDLADGLIGGAVVERGAFEDYCRAWPKRAAQLQVLLQSETFPAGVLVYHARKLPAEIVRRVREGLLNAKRTREGKDLLDMCRMNGFENPPADYQQALEDIARAYPEPR